MSDRVLIFDTTPRDGAQAGHTMPDFAKEAHARKAVKVGVDILEIGFPIASPGEAAAIQKIVTAVKGLRYCVLSRAVKEDIDCAGQSVSGAEDAMIHTFISTSDIHIERKLRSDRETVLARAVAAVKLAKTYRELVEFSAEDATRTDPDYLARIVKAAIEAGATSVNIPDTVGYIMPEKFFELLRYLYDQVPILSNVVLSVHCHNDLGLATANSLAGVRAGARQVEGCWDGIGERAGNTALEQIVAALETHKSEFQVYTGIKTSEIGPLCRKLSRLIAYPIPEHAPVIGKKAFEHSSGIHRDGVNKARETYEIMLPEAYGHEGTSIELVSHLGRNGLGQYLTDLGYDGPALIEQVYPQYLALADAKGKLTNEDLHMIVQELRIRREIDHEQLFDLVDAKPGDFNYGPTFGAVRIRRNGRSIARWATGDGSIAALHQAIREAIAELGVDLTGLELKEFRVEKGLGSSEAIGWVTIQVTQGERTGYGRSGDPNTIVATAKAYVYAINHMLNCPVAAKLGDELA
jgi:2-isopropylmalate synthase